MKGAAPRTRRRRQDRQLGWIVVGAVVGGALGLWVGPILLVETVMLLGPAHVLLGRVLGLALYEAGTWAPAVLVSLGLARLRWLRTAPARLAVLVGPLALELLLVGMVGTLPAAYTSWPAALARAAGLAMSGVLVWRLTP